MFVLPEVSLGSLALAAAAVIAAELLHRRDDDLGTDEAAPDRFSVTAPIVAATALVLGPWPALLVGALGSLGVRRLAGDPWRESAVRALSLGAAGFAGGYAYVLAGSETGAVVLPDDLLGLAVLGMVFSAVKTLVNRLAARATAIETDLLAAAAEVSLGAALAVAAESNLWYAALLAPVLLLLERLHWRLIGLRREVAAALETFANIVDERDRSTRGHSVRVADSVRELAEALDLPRSDVRRLWWAGRLHDLGKVAVDASVLGKPTRLNDEEWAAVRRAPRLSARLLQRFRFAAHQAKAVEYHRERLDGSGYYGARGKDIPLAAHFLIVADSFDAMTSHRPFRRRLTREEALAEIEENAGTQFHPAIAKAFVAVQRGLPPTGVLSEGELSAIRDSSVPSPLRSGLGELGSRPELLIAAGATLGLVGVGTELIEVAAAGAAVALLGGLRWLTSRIRAHRLAKALADAVSAEGRTAVFGRVADSFEGAWRLDFALLVAWEEDGTGGSVELQRGESGVADPELTSWLLREADSGRELISDDGSQLARPGSSLALPLRRENSSLVGFFVLGGPGRPPAHVVAAARASLDRIGLALATPRSDAPPGERRLVAVP
ncbi:MAG TPA: HD domain-containing phosphohydrolase [Gaiellaceae bacterium]|nr:HD domain-containing phosphohydrolase [Gaiellaceae bacterium]